MCFDHFSLRVLLLQIRNELSRFDRSHLFLFKKSDPRSNAVFARIYNKFQCEVSNSHSRRKKCRRILVDEGLCISCAVQVVQNDQSGQVCECAQGEGGFTVWVAGKCVERTDWLTFETTRRRIETWKIRLEGSWPSSGRSRQIHRNSSSRTVELSRICWWGYISLFMKTTISLQELWSIKGNRPSFFADLGCGNGLLVHLLNKSGVKGCGLDVRKRDIWLASSHSSPLEFNAVCRSSLMASADLRESVVDPNTEGFGLPPNVDFLIGNHSDELTPWIPVMAARLGCNFMVIPCCPFGFYAKYNTKDKAEGQKGRMRFVCVLHRVHIILMKTGLGAFGSGPKIIYEG